ncbi:hypothetical protein M011DRAFT_470767 [Sporormia fimetaria CBS 119925]|uniref:Uncharacterized protein n=1 Tax=Sporormia fimetaria CBS 119925 TaxID=1340428 RepID=A0A6A6V4J1_9PLEO|nr:hypothetical protein M011DRAFT_470767 [Sporormia fimetaria CBS 119925]
MRHPHNTSLSSDTSHRDKRPFQPSITSFFARDESYDGGFDERGAATTGRGHSSQRLRGARDGGFPDVPGTVQADLLSVGMRVRKSVPEGYKTHKTAALPSIQTTMINTNTAAPVASNPPREPVPDTLLHQRELLPFCGLHKIGGYAEQPVTNVHLYGGTEGGSRPVNLFPLPAEAFNQPFSSQSSSTESLPPNPTNPHKRSWQDDEDSNKPFSSNSDFLFAVPMKIAEDDIPVSPLSESPTPPIHGLPQSALRPFAQPRTRKQPARSAGLKETDIDMDMENVEHHDTNVMSTSSSDFGEAPFLKPWTRSDEVDMSGM